MNFIELALHVPTILLPKREIDMTKWSVIACDQYTSQPEYWGKVKDIIADSPSTHNIIYPEIFLEEDNKQIRIKNIHDAMNTYLNENKEEDKDNENKENSIFEEKKGFILVKRQLSNKKIRNGLIVALDLEAYDYNEGSQSLIRATEGTIIERLPSRIEVRKDAQLESPHIMVLIDDPGKTVIEPLFKEKLKIAYDFDLMLNAGHITGYMIDHFNMIGWISDNLRELIKNNLLYAMGDGNHSFATAKAVWEELKKNGVAKNHPARYALVELVNLYDESLEFEPIHRVVFNIDCETILTKLKTHFNNQEIKITELSSVEEVDLKKGHAFILLSKNKKFLITLGNPGLVLPIGSLQKFLDSIDAKIDYIHGKDTVIELASKDNNLGFLLPQMSKYDLFNTIVKDGSLPRKTFSMGEADDKRFYLECRKII